VHKSWSGRVFDENNSPFRKNLHIEGGEGKEFSIVPTCTYATGQITGSVIGASDNNPVKTRVIAKLNGVEIYSTDTDDDGKFSFEEFKTGDDIDVVSYKVRKNWNAITGDENIVAQGSIESNDEGNFELNLKPGNYTIQFEKDGYIDNEMNVAVVSNSEQTLNVAMSPEQLYPNDGLIRIVLTWGENPYDIDSHLTGPTSDGNGRYEIYYNNLALLFNFYCDKIILVCEF